MNYAIFTDGLDIGVGKKRAECLCTEFTCDLEFNSISHYKSEVYTPAKPLIISQLCVTLPP